MPSINGITTPVRAAAPSTPAPSSPTPTPTPTSTPTPAAQTPKPSPAPKPVAPGFKSVDPRTLREEAAEKPVAKPADVDFDDIEFTQGDEQPRGEKDPRAAESADPQPAEGVEFIMPEKPETEEDDESQDEPAAEQPSQPTSGKRDYSQFDPEVAKVLSKLPNATFNAFKTKLAEWKAAADQLPELKNKLETISKEKPRFLAEHPNAFALQPEYTQAVETFNEAGAEASHWMEQLVKIKSGQAWEEWTGYDEKGKPIARQHPATADGKVDPRAEILVSQHLQAASSAQQQAKIAAQQIAKNHEQYYKSAAEELQSSREKFFPKMDPAKLPADEKKFYQSAIDVIPAAYREHPLAPLLGLAFVSVKRLAAYAKKQEEAARAKAAPNTPAVGPRRAPAGRMANAGNILDLDKEFGPGSDN